MTQENFPWDAPETESYPDLNYLLSEAAQSRYVLAEHYLRDCETIVEIGGFKTPITKFVTTPKRRILVLDPKMPEFHAETLLGRPCRVDHLRARFQDFTFDLKPRSYGLVILGLSLKYFTDDGAESGEWTGLVNLIDNARLSVIEFPLAWDLGRQEVDFLLERTKTTVRFQVDLDFTESPGFDTDFHLRRFMVLDPA